MRSCGNSEFLVHVTFICGKHYTCDFNYTSITYAAICGPPQPKTDMACRAGRPIHLSVKTI